MWRSLVAHLLWEQGAGSSNLPIPTTSPLVDAATVAGTKAGLGDRPQVDHDVPAALRGDGGPLWGSRVKLDIFAFDAPAARGLTPRHAPDAGASLAQGFLASQSRTLPHLTRVTFSLNSYW